MLRFATILLLGTMAAASTPPPPPAELEAIDCEQIAQTLHDHGLSVSPNQVGLMSRVPSTKTNPDLEVISAEQWEGNRQVVRLRCAKSVVCLPFFVLVRWPTKQAMQSAMEHWKVGPSTDAKLNSVLAPLAIHAGDHATLVIQSGRLRIELQVICLENGKIGRSIRVTSQDHKNIYKAEIVGPKLLKEII